MKYLVLLLIVAQSYGSDKLDSTQRYLGFRHNHNGSAHKALNLIKDQITPVINKGRVNVYKISNPSFKLINQPKIVKDQFFKIIDQDLNFSPEQSNKSLFSKKEIYLLQ